MAFRGRGGRVPQRHNTRLQSERSDDQLHNSTPRHRDSTSRPGHDVPSQAHPQVRPPSQDPFSQSHTNILPEGQTDIPPESQTDVPPVMERNTRGRTTATVETTRRSGDPRVKVLLYNGNAVGENELDLKNTVLGWLKKPSQIRQDVKQFDQVPFKQREGLFQRINETFEITVVNDPLQNRPMTPGASSSRPPSTLISRRGRAPDPTACLPLPLEQRLVIERWVKARFRDHRSRICERYYDTKETNEERLANPPPLWPDDQWKWVVDYWGTDEFKEKRRRGKRNKGANPRKHTGGARGFQTRLYDIMSKTGKPADLVAFFKQMRTKKADKSYVDDESRQAAEMMDDLVLDYMDEEGNLTVPSQQIVNDVIGPGKKGKQPLEGRVPPKRTRVTIEDLQRVQEDADAKVEKVRQEAAQELQTMRADITSMVQEAIQKAMMNMGNTPQQSAAQVSSQNRGEDDLNDDSDDDGYEHPLDQAFG